MLKKDGRMIMFKVFESNRSGKEANDITRLIGIGCFFFDISDSGSEFKVKY